MPKKAKKTQTSTAKARTPADRTIVPPPAGELARVQQEIDAAFHLSAIVGSSADAIISKDLYGVITSWNSGAERIFNYSAAEAIGQPVSMLIPPERGDEESRILTRIRKGERVEHFETVRRRRDGSNVDISLTVSPIKDASGTVIGASKVARDITEQLRDRELLRRSEELHRVTLSCIGDAVISTDHKGRVTFMNSVAEGLTGWSQQEAVGNPLEQSFKIFNELSGQPAENPVTKVMREGAVVGLGNHTVLTSKDGTQRPIDDSAAPIRNAAGDLIGVVLVFRDVTVRKRAEEALRASEEQFRTLADNIAQFAWMADDQGSIFWYNKRWYEYTGTTPEEMQGRGWMKVQHPEHVDRVVARLQASWDTGRSWEDLFPLRGKDGNYRWFLSRAHPIRDSSGRIVRWLGTNTDVTDQRATEEALRRGALHDALTDLPNRAFFGERVSQALARMRVDSGYRFAVLLLDCDGFKAVNDSLGHAAGDRVLTEIAGRLRTCVRPGDLVARLGGDEFTVLLEGIAGLADVEQAARRMQDSLAAPHALADREIVTTASIGAALSKPNHKEPEDLLREADLAMYHAKQLGRARLQVFDVALRDSTRARSDMEADLRKALERQEFRLVLQPIVELETGGLRGFEALLRWQRPKRGVVTPIDFVTLAEQTGLILPIGRWVLQEACRHARSFQDASPAGAPVRMSVNLAGQQLGHPDIVDEVRSAVREAGIAPSSLILEIGEWVLVENVEASKAMLQRLRDVGVELYLDDFGKLNSSLADLPLFPLQGIKLDRALVRRVGARRTDLEVVRSIVDLARSLGLGVIAKGVETIAQRERLIAFGCELGQGYLFAKPLEARAAAKFLARTDQSGRRTA